MPIPFAERTLRMGLEYEKDQMSYRDRLAHEMKNPVFDKLFAYNEAGDLYFKDTRLTIRELMEAHGIPQDAPIQITNLLQVEARASQLVVMVNEAARNVGYPDGHMQVHYATKANPKAEVVTSAMRHTHIETSSPQDLENIEQMIALGIMSPEDGKKIVCNGPKDEATAFDRGYMRRAIDLHNDGFDVTVVLDENELHQLTEPSPIDGRLQVGLRLKFGEVDTESELANERSRFGFDWPHLQQEADMIKTLPHLKLTMLHAMVSAAETLEPKEFVKSLLFAAEKYAALKKDHPELTHLNMGGGIPSAGSGYDYKAFFESYFAGVKEICEKYEIDPPTIVFESGSFITNDCETLVFEVKEEKINDADQTPWLRFNGSFSNLPDIHILDVPYDFIAATNAKAKTHRVGLGDSSCDSNYVYPRKGDTKTPLVLMPKDMKGQLMAVPLAGNYQDVISGIGEKVVLHCGAPEPIRVFIYKDEQGNVQVEGATRPSMVESSRILGFKEESLHRLRINNRRI